MTDAITVNRDEYERLVRVEAQARVTRAKQKEFYSTNLHSTRQRQYALRKALQEEKRLDALLDHTPVQAEMPLCPPR